MILSQRTLTSLTEKYKPQLSVEDIEEILGIEKFDEEIAEKTRFVLHPLSLALRIETSERAQAFVRM